MGGAKICRNCGMIYYDAKVLKVIEKRFFAIQKKLEKPDHYMDDPSSSHAAYTGHVQPPSWLTIDWGLGTEDGR